MTRRQFLHTGLLTLGTLGLAACGGTAAPASSAAQSASAAASVAAKPSASPSKLLPIVAGQGATVAVSSPMWMADYLKLYQKHGVDFTLKMVAATATTPALLNKEIDVSISSAAPTLTANLMGNIDQVYIAAYVTQQTVSMHVNPSIKSAADLKGKLVGSDRPGTPTDFNTRQVLNVVGLKPSDVQIVPLGASDVNVKAIMAGQVQAIVMPPPFSFQAEAAGFPMFANAWGKPNLTNGAIALRPRLEELAAALQGFVAALREGAEAFDAQPDVALKVIQQYTKEDNPEIVKKTYEFFTTKVRFDKSLQPSVEGLQAMLDFLGDTTIPAAKNAKPEQFFDTRFIDKLPK